MLLATVVWQIAYCLRVAGGNPTALFLIGGLPQPPELDRGAFHYAHSGGYDGQLYRIIAHDPLFRKGYARYLDDARYRYRRILVPGAAAIVGGGEAKRVDLAYVAVTDVLLAAGGVWFALLAAPAVPPVLAAGLYCLVPAIVASTDRMVLDGVLVAGFLAALFFYRRDRLVPLAATAGLLPLVREAGVLVWAGVLAACLLRRAWVRAAAVAAAALPWLAWYGFVALRTSPSYTAELLLSLPLLPMLQRLFTVVPRPVTPPVNLLLEVLDVAACLALLFSLAYFAGTVWRDVRAGRGFDDVLVAGPVILLAACSGGPRIMGEPYDFMRVTSVAVVWTVLRLLPARRWFAVVLLLASSSALLIYRAAALLRA